MTPREKAIGEAAKAKFKVDWPYYEWSTVGDSIKEPYVKDAIIHIDAYLAALEAEGGARKGFGHWSKDGTIMLNSDKFSESEIPLLIIKL
jgi:hypothetical protein